MAKEKPFPDVAVTCSHCSAEITFPKPDKVGKEFSLHCPKCGRRKMYPDTAIHAVGMKS